MPEGDCYALQIKLKEYKNKSYFGIDDFHIIKIIITDTTPYINDKKVVNLTWKF